MGTYVNPGNAAFREAINSKIYIDKTELIAYTNSVLNTKQKNICVSRPRRFGKSMAADMLAAYYSRGCNSAELFAGTKIEAEKSFSSHLNRHSVIRLDVQRFLEKERDLDTFIDEIEKKVISDLAREFPDFKNFTADSRLKTLLEQIFAETGKGFIFVIDEWDCVFRMAKDQKEKQ